ncbi:MAG: hypothetical protein ACI4HQ_02670 [Acetatifactor sp.]
MGTNRLIPAETVSVCDGAGCDRVIGRLIRRFGKGKKHYEDCIAGFDKEIS